MAARLVRGLRVTFMAVLAASLASQAFAQAFSNFTTLAGCDLGPTATIAAQTACSLTPVQSATTLQPNQAVLVPFTNLNTAVFQGLSIQGWSSAITASNPTSTSQTIFFMFGVCDNQASAITCATGYYNRAASTGLNAALPAACSTNCALASSSIDNPITISTTNLANWRNPQYYPGLSNTTLSLTTAVPSTGTVNLASRTNALSFGSGFVFFMGSLSTIPITVTLTLTSATTTQSPYPPSPSPTPAGSPVPTPSSGDSSLSSGAIAGIVIGAIAGVILLAALAFFVMRGRKGKKSEVAPTTLPDDQPAKAAAEV